jgi:Kef-type K+ transport system membrane component KefB
MPRGDMRSTIVKGSVPWVAYSAMLLAVVGAYLWLRSYGDRLAAPSPRSGEIFGSAAVHGQINEMLHVLLALVLVIATARALGTLFRLIHQPPVVGEIIAGILLGPSLLGRFAPAASGYLLPPQIAPYLNVLAQIGVILYMFLVGLELDPALLRKRGHSTVAISHASILAPFLLGGIIALFLYPRLSTSDVPFTVFSLFLGVSMSVTAFPVLARILTDRKIHRSRMGVIALTCAAVDDVTAWCLLAFVVGVAEARATGVLATIGLALAYIAAMAFIVRPAMVRISLMYGNRGRLTQGVMATIFVTLLLSAFATEFIGIHAVFGAFALGAIIPHDSGLARDLTDRLEDVVIVLLLPAFFAFTGLRTQIGLVSGYQAWAICALIVAVASIGKFGGSAIAARLTGLGWRDSSALGVLMNTRGLMELIVLNIGLELRVISPELFAMLVIMALLTTFATTPALHLITRGAPDEEEPAFQVTQRPALVGTERHAVLVPISNPEGVPHLIELALAATPHEAPPPRVLALVRIPPGGVRSGLREAEQRVPPRSPALSAALDLAWAKGAVITPQAVWTDDPAQDIVNMASQPQIGWLLLGSHRSVFGSDFKGGVVREILDKTSRLPIHVGVVVHGSERVFDRIFAVIDNSVSGRAVMELAARVGERRKCNVHTLLALRRGIEAGPELLEMIREASRAAPRRVHSDVLHELSVDQLARQAPSGLVIISTHLAERIGLAPAGFIDDQRTLVVVQGSLVDAIEADEAERERQRAQS